MSSETAISVANVSKRFEMYSQPRDRLLQFFSFGKRQHFKEFWAIKNVSFNINRGEIVGILGPNGAGKSTLLQIICGTVAPTNGEVSIRGRVSALLELGSGFNPEFTGVENIYLNANILGISTKEIRNKIDEIANFADIGEFINHPVKSYSSGMYARLAFAVAISVEPEILIVDETLSVGDLLFQAKAIQRMRSLMTKCTVLFVSHSLATVKSFCDRAIFIDKGELVRDGSASEVCDFYEKAMQERLFAKVKLQEFITQKNSDRTLDLPPPLCSMNLEPDCSFPESGNEFRSGSGALRVIRGDLLVNGQPSKLVDFQDELTLRIVIISRSEIKAGAIVGYMVRNVNAIDVFGRNLYNEREFLPALKTGQKVVITFRFPCLLSQGRYSISIGVKSEPYIPEFFDSIHVARVFEVTGIPGNYVPGLVYVSNDIDIDVVDEAHQ